MNLGPLERVLSAGWETDMLPRMLFYAVRCSALGWLVVAIVGVAGSLVGGCFQFVVFAL